MDRESGGREGGARQEERDGLHWSPPHTPQVKEITFLKNTVMECDACGERGWGSRDGAAGARGDGETENGRRSGRKGHREVDAGRSGEIG